MGRNTKWTQELQKEMFDFFKNDEKQGKSVNESAENFAQKYEGMTASQVKSAYYKFNKSNNETSTDRRSNWTEKENGMLLHAIQTKKGTLTSVFEEFARKTNRTPQNVSQHYYFLIRNVKNENNQKVENSKAQNTKTNNIPKNARQNKNNQQATRTNGNNQTNIKTTNSKQTNKTQFDFNAMIKDIKKLPPDAVKGIQYIIKATKQ